MRSLILLITLGSIAVGNSVGGGSSARGTNWKLRKFENLITFGDSYTDEGRLGYFWGHNGNAVPIGTVLPFSEVDSDGGIIWDRWVSIYTKAQLFDYATAGAVCSNNIVKKYVSGIANPIPDVLGSQIPSFIGDTKYINSSTGTNTVYGRNRKADNSVYAIWIGIYSVTLKSRMLIFNAGTNDLGSDSFFTDSTFAGTTIVNYTRCVFDAFDAIYAAGGRNFVLMNTAPLQLSPEYGILDGVGPNQYWQNKPSNITAVGYKMWEYTSLVNEIFRLQIPYEVHVSKRFKDAGFALFDVNSLMTDIFNNPSQYLNGTSPLDVTNPYHQCNITTGTCVNATASFDSYYWWDEVHPSVRVFQVIADAFVNITKGSSRWAQYW
ncbi:hypothetical protein F5884DRAFT_874362 [Xylogone sp. PMI_703]|nr:hypothetical protein F5884DRAFT_874362 [Xylogone sp. PMI_703]